MLTRDITCINCGTAGKIEVLGNNNISSSCIFPYKGHNPFSSNMHYQCPVCEMMLLVDPMTILNDDIISSLPHLTMQERFNRWIANLSWQASLF